MLGQIFNRFKVIYINIGLLRHELEIVGLISTSGDNGNRSTGDGMHELLGDVVVTIRVLDGYHELVPGEQLDVAFHVLTRMVEPIAETETVRVHTGELHQSLHVLLAAVIGVTVRHDPNDQRLTLFLPE